MTAEAISASTVVRVNRSSPLVRGDELPASAQFEVASRLDAGTVWVNSHVVLATEALWGGFNGSGYGRDLSIYAGDDFARTKHLMHKHSR